MRSNVDRRRIPPPGISGQAETSLLAQRTYHPLGRPPSGMHRSRPRRPRPLRSTAPRLFAHRLFALALIVACPIPLNIAVMRRCHAHSSSPRHNAFRTWHRLCARPGVLCFRRHHASDRQQAVSLRVETPERACRPTSPHCLQGAAKTPWQPGAVVRAIAGATSRHLLFTF